MSLAYLEMMGYISFSKKTTRYFDKQNALYEANKEWLIAEHPLKYVALYEDEIVGIYDTSDAAFHANKDMVLAKKCSIRADRTSAFLFHAGLEGERVHQWRPLAVCLRTESDCRLRF